MDVKRAFWISCLLIAVGVVFFEFPLLILIAMSLFQFVIYYSIGKFILRHWRMIGLVLIFTGGGCYLILSIARFLDRVF